MYNNLIVLISGRGSNLEALCKAGLAPYIKAVISNNNQATGLEIAAQHAILTHIIDHRKYQSREAFDTAIAACIDAYKPDLIVLAGFMRILGQDFVIHYKNRIINIHPSILPAFIGANAQEDALNTKVKVSGATVHLVSDTVDAGAIIAQGIVPVLAEDTRDALAARILELEHVIYPFVIKKFLANQVSITGNQVSIISADSDKTLLGKFYPHIYY